ncbi:MAG: hypothetical protein CMO44_17105 [Verrucomicrobiales bacterium]|nr:hypothetical protein [Verrucomicrobiales bacterium]
MSDIIVSKPKVLYEHVLELRNVCYRTQEPSQDAMTEDNFILMSAILLKQLLESLHIKVEVIKDATILQNIHLHVACFEKHILGTTVMQDQKDPTLEDLIKNVESLKLRMQRKDTYCLIL